MEEKTNEEAVEETKEEETEEKIEDETPEDELTTDTDWEAEAKKARGIAQRLRTKLTKATEKKVEKVEPKVEPVKKEPNTGELDETALDFLDLKGFTEDEDITLIENIVAKTGQTVRQVLKDEYVVSKLETNKVAREAKKGTPGSTQRGGATGDTFDTDMAKYESTKEYPDDFERRSKVVNALEAKESFKIPSYRKSTSFQK